MLTIIAMMATLMAVTPPQTSPDRAAFESLKAMRGEWREVGRPRPFTLSYRTMSSDKVVVETWTRSNGQQSITVFLMEGERLIATRYSALGEHPTMSLTSAADGELAFTFRSAVNTPTGDGSYIRAMSIRRDGNRMTRTDTFRAYGADEISRWELARIR